MNKFRFRTPFWLNTRFIRLLVFVIIISFITACGEESPEIPVVPTSPPSSVTPSETPSVTQAISVTPATPTSEAGPTTAPEASGIIRFGRIENQDEILNELLKRWIKGIAGFDVIMEPPDEMAAVRQALEEGKIHLYWQSMSKERYNEQKSQDEPRGYVWLGQLDISPNDDNPALVIRQSTLEAFPRLREKLVDEFLGKIGSRLDESVMKKLNDCGNEFAADWFFKGKPQGCLPVIVGSDNSPENWLLGKMLVLLLKNEGYEVDGTRLGKLGETEEAHKALVERQINVLPENPDEVLAWINDLDEPQNLVVLDLVENPLAAPVVHQALLKIYPNLTELLGIITFYLEDSLVARVEIGADGKPNSEENVETVARSALCAHPLYDCPTTPTPVPEPTKTTEATEDTKSKCEERIVNGSFEDDQSWILPNTKRSARYTTDKIHSGNRALLLGIISGEQDIHSYSIARQRVDIPPNAESVTLSYWYYPILNESVDGDLQLISIKNSEGAIIREELWGDTSNEQDWVFSKHNLSDFRGSEVTLDFNVINYEDGDSLPAMYIDDISLQVCSDSQ